MTSVLRILLALTCGSSLGCVVRRAPPSMVGTYGGAESGQTGSSAPEVPVTEQSSLTPVETSTVGPTAPSDATSGGGEAATRDRASRDDVTAAIAPLAGQLRACGRGHPATLMLQLTFASAGELVSARPQESATGSQEATCLARVLAPVRVPPFREATTALWYPFAIE